MMALYAIKGEWDIPVAMLRREPRRPADTSNLPERLGADWAYWSAFFAAMRGEDGYDCYDCGGDTVSPSARLDEYWCPCCGTEQ
jgi:hypothetical protein